MRYKPELSFARIVDAYVVVRGELVGDVTCQRIVRHILVARHDENSKNDDTPIGNVISLYNTVFIPRMKHYLLKSKSIKRATEALRSSKGWVQSPAKAELLTATGAAKPDQQHAQEEQHREEEVQAEDIPSSMNVDNQLKEKKCVESLPAGEIHPDNHNADDNTNVKDLMDIEKTA